MAASEPGSPASWRDVYTLVESVKDDIAVVKTDLTKVLDDHEGRLRGLETTDKRQIGFLNALSAGQKTIILISSIGGFVIVATDFIQRLVT